MTLLIAILLIQGLHLPGFWYPIAAVLWLVHYQQYNN